MREGDEVLPELLPFERFLTELSRHFEIWQMYYIMSCQDAACQGIPREQRLLETAAVIDSVIRAYVTTYPDSLCRCTLGVQLCPMHPDHLRTKEEKIAFRMS